MDGRVLCVADSECGRQSVAFSGQRVWTEGGGIALCVAKERSECVNCCEHQ